MEEKVDWMLESILSPRGPTSGVNYLTVVCMLVVLIIMFKNRIDNYLVKADYTQNKGSF